MQNVTAPLLPLLSIATFVLGAAMSPLAGAADACSLLTKELVAQFTPYDKNVLDLVMRVSPTADQVGRSGSACTYGGITLQVDPFPWATIEKQRDQEWQLVKGLGDGAYFRDNGGRWGELYAKAGSRVLTIQMGVPTGRTVMAIQPNIFGLAKAVLSKMK